jgi:hypothetical protein
MRVISSSAILVALPKLLEWFCKLNQLLCLLEVKGCCCWSEQVINNLMSHLCVTVLLYLSPTWFASATVSVEGIFFAIQSIFPEKW